MAYVRKYPALFQEGKIGKITVPNRIIMSPMGVGHFGEYFEERLVDFYGTRAKGGAGVVFTENNYVSSFEEDPYPQLLPVPRFDSKRKISRAHAIATRIKEFGSVPGLQLGAGQGRNADTPMPDKPPMSASAIPTMKDPSIICKEMTQEDIDNKVAAFERAAAMAKECGFRIIEVHAHSGYLVEQFLSENLNHRTDKYGGSLENRFRFAKEILDGIRRQVGDDLAVSIRMSVDHMVPDGITLEEGLEYCKLAEKAGYDIINIDAGSRAAADWTIPTPYNGETPLRKFAKAVKEVVSIPVITVGSYLTPDLAEDALESGDADFVAVGRAILADPDWPNKAKAGKDELIRGCIQCNERCTEYCNTSKAATCSVNPLAGNETTLPLYLTLAETPKRITAVGGGPASMVLALVASRRGHKVTIMEKSDRLGGNMNLVAVEKAKAGVRNYRNYIVHQIELHKEIDVKLNCEATIESIRETDPDVVVVATGSTLFIPKIPGFIDNDKVVTIKTLYEKTELKGDEDVIVVGGGVNGSEVALALAEEGHKVTIVEMLDSIASNLGSWNRMSLLSQINKNPNITVMTKTKCSRIVGTTLYCENENGEEISIPFDLVIAALGMRSENELGLKVLEEFPEAYMIGDAVRHEKIGDAVHAGFFTALKI